MPIIIILLVARAPSGVRAGVGGFSLAMYLF
jgi:hypothetical protein